MSTVALQEKKPLIKFDPNKCAFCKICEQSCAEFHYGKYGTSHARITVVRRGPLAFRYNMCTRCAKRYCIAACPKRALTYKGGNIVVDPALCDSLGLCVKACPFHGIRINPETGKPIICDLCGGDPSCVKACPKTALSLVWLPEDNK